MIIRGLESAANGMLALMDQNDSTANNIANVNTVGYKNQVLTFKNIYESDVVSKNHDTEEFKSVGSLSIGSTVQKLTYDFTQGALTKTDNTFDLAIAGDGFFKIESSRDGQLSYTRNGSFTMNNRGELVTKDGDYVLDGNSKHIKINTNGVVIHSYKDITINEEGTIQIISDTDRVNLQKIGIFDFSNKEDLRNIGGSQFVPKTGDMNPELKAEKYTIAQGSLELSNSNLVNEMIKTISTSRNYESLSKVVKSSSDTLTEALRVGRL